MKPRLIVLRVPVRVFRLMIVALGTTIGMVGALLGFVFVFMPSRQSGLFLNFVVLMLCVGIPGFLSMKFMEVAVRGLSRLRMQLRDKRLERVLNHPDGERRLPHRWIEEKFRERFVPWWAVKGLARKLPAGTMIMVVDRKAFPVNRPTVCDRVFDPIRMMDRHDEQRIRQLIDEEVSETESTSSEKKDQKNSLRSQERRAKRMQIFIFLSMILFAVVQVVHSLQSGKSLRFKELGIALSLTSVLAVFIFALLLMRRKWYLVPGGFFCDRFKSWRGDSKILRFTAKDSAFLYYQAMSIVVLVKQGKVYRLQMTPAGAMLALGTWMGNAEGPSEEQLRGLFGERSEG